MQGNIPRAIAGKMLDDGWQEKKHGRGSNVSSGRIGGCMVSKVLRKSAGYICKHIIITNSCPEPLLVIRSRLRALDPEFPFCGFFITAKLLALVKA
jgi:hypothetical protein